MAPYTTPLSTRQLIREIWRAPQDRPDPVADLIIKTEITESHDELQEEWDLKFTGFCRVDVFAHIREQKAKHAK